MISPNRMGPHRTWLFVLRGFGLGVIYASFWSVLVGLLRWPLLTVVWWAYTGYFPALVSAIDPGAILVYATAIFLLTFFFSTLAGSLLAWLLLKRAGPNAVGQRDAASLGRWVAAVAASVINIILLATLWAPLSPTGVDALGQSNQSFMTENTLLTFWAILSLITAIGYGQWAGKVLSKRLYPDGEAESNGSVTL